MKVCRFYLKGTCDKGDRCSYQHPPPCRAYENTGHCKYGAHCKYAHFKDSDGAAPMATDNPFGPPSTRRSDRSGGSAAAASGDVVVVSKRPLRRRSSAASFTTMQADDYANALVTDVNLDETSLEQITKLFNRMDQTSDGHLTPADFVHFPAKWATLRVEFDLTGDGKVSMDEFRECFKRHALKQPAAVTGLPAASTPLRLWIAEMERRVNLRIQETCAELFAWWANPAM
eukprot:m.11908 g.11908  ORF g.11908 m.11908 type:complete len:230 (+) comp4143_c0_seq1:57-746(+)